MKIGMLGAGAYGSAIAGILRDNHHTVKFYDPARFPNATLDSVASWAEVIFIAVPANVVRILLKELPEETFRKPAVILTKGIMDLSVWEQFRYFEIVSGPGFAEDIVKHKRFQLTVAARTATQGETLAEDLLKAPYLKFDKTEDRLGVALLSGLKNIFAIESGRRCLENTSQAYKDYLALAYRQIGRRMDPFVIDYTPCADPRGFMRHETEEFFVVLEGALDFRLFDDTNSHIMKNGDTLYLRANIPHRVLLAPECEHAKALVIYTDPDPAAME